VTRCTTNNYFSDREINCYFYTGAALRMVRRIRLRFWKTRPPTHYHASIYHRHLITHTFYHS